MHNGSTMWTTLAKSPHLSKDLRFIVCSMHNYLLPTSCHFVTIKSGEIYSHLYKCSHESICLSLPLAPSSRPVSSCFILLHRFLNHTLLSDTVSTQLESHTGLGFQACFVLTLRKKETSRNKGLPQGLDFFSVFQSLMSTALTGSLSDPPHGRKGKASLSQMNTIQGDMGSSERRHLT